MYVFVIFGRFFRSLILLICIYILFEKFPMVFAIDIHRCSDSENIISKTRFFKSILIRLSFVNIADKKKWFDDFGCLLFTFLISCYPCQILSLILGSVCRDLVKICFAMQASHYFILPEDSVPGWSELSVEFHECCVKPVW